MHQKSNKKKDKISTFQNGFLFRTLGLVQNTKDKPLQDKLNQHKSQINLFVVS